MHTKHIPVEPHKMLHAIAAWLTLLLPASAYADIYMQQNTQEEIYLTNLIHTEQAQIEQVQAAAHGATADSIASAGNRQFKVLVADEKKALSPLTKPKSASATPKHAVLTILALPFSQAVNRAAADTALEPALLHAVIAVESNNNPRAVSARGARGLMQLMPATSKRYAVADPHDPGQNIAAGARYLQSLQRQFKGDMRLTLAAYNAGPNAVIKSGFKIPPFSETQHYVPKVMLLYDKLRDADAL